jgi:hypothetical protein
MGRARTHTMMQRAYVGHVLVPRRERLDHVAQGAEALVDLFCLLCSPRRRGGGWCPWWVLVRDTTTCRAVARTCSVCPDAPVFDSSSLPARSTRYTREFVTACVVRCVLVRWITKTP